MTGPGSGPIAVITEPRGDARADVRVAAEAPTEDAGSTGSLAGRVIVVTPAAPKRPDGGDAGGAPRRPTPAVHREHALAMIAIERPEVVVLATDRPRVEAVDLLGRIRHTSDVPVLVVTRCRDEVDRVVCFESGADDYLAQPFTSRELMARLRSLQRRARQREADPLRLEFPGLVIDRTTRRVTVRGVAIDLTSKEFDLLAFLAMSPASAFSRDELLREVWHSCSEWQTVSTVTEHVRRVRQKIEEGGGSSWIRTVRGVGYRFDPPAA